jgi:hypothetical protein
VLAGSASLVPLAMRFQPELLRPLLWVLGSAIILQWALAWGEITLTHATAHARLAVHEMVAGRFRLAYRAAIWLSAGGFTACLPGVTLTFPQFLSWWGGAAAALALAGLLAYEHAYVQAGQSVPLA